MAKVQFLGPIEKEDIEVDVNSLRELKKILNRDLQLKKWLKVSGVAVNDELVYNIDFPLSKDDVVSIIPPVCGG